MKYDTIEDAAHAWVREFNAFPSDMVSMLMDCDPDAWEEVTPPAVGDRVYLYNTPDDCSSDEGEIIDYSKGVYIIVSDDAVQFSAKEGDFDVVKLDLLPMWGVMWGFGDGIDEYWVDELEGLRALADCGFRVYHHEDWGYFFGIDGAGYDFFDAHWIPLYKKRGLKWHKEAGYGA